MKEGNIMSSITGTVKFFNADKGYGFILPEDGSGDIFFHYRSVENVTGATSSRLCPCCAFVSTYVTCDAPSTARR